MSVRSSTRPARPIPTVIPENTTALPVVASVRASASAGVPCVSSSRKRLTTKSE